LTAALLQALFVSRSGKRTIDDAESPNFGYWRVGVVGSSHRLSIHAAKMCEALGARLARETTIVIVHGGLKRRSQDVAAGSLAADWHFVEGVKRVLKGQYHERLETVLSELDSQFTASEPPTVRSQLDDKSAEMFVEGTLRRIKGRTREARRFGFVNSLDAIVAVGGGYGTRQQLTLAAAIDQPILPVPCFEGAAADFWKEHCNDLVSQFGISESTARDWEKEPATLQDLEKLADTMLSAFTNSVAKARVRDNALRGGARYAIRSRYRTSRSNVPR
jgi:predicted Rossmann-fold nucleotide-binding protein